MVADRNRRHHDHTDSGRDCHQAGLGHAAVLRRGSGNRDHGGQAGALGVGWLSGHRLSTMEVESALVAHEKVAEAAVVGRPDDIKGQAISAFVTLEQGITPTDALREELKKWVAKEIGSLAKPDDIRFTDTLPKTRSGKIMRRLLRELASSGEVKGDTTTLEDFGIIAKLKEQDEV